MFNSPLPSPSVFDEPTFSTKKEIRDRHIRRDTPRPPPKSAPTQSRCFPHRFLTKDPQLVTFKSDTNHSFFRSKNYDAHSKELFFHQIFDVEYKIGSGSFGEVYRVRSKEDGTYYAVKKAMETYRSKTDREKKLEEVQKHEELPRHPNLVKYIQAWEEKGYLYIQTELCQMSLKEYADNNSDIPEYQLWFILVDLLQAVEHLHGHNMVHLDIKPANIFVSRDGIFKLGDFGLVLDMNKSKRSSEEGDAKYMAPETLDGYFTPAADIFSVGLTILEMATDLDIPKSGDCWHLLRSGNLPVALAPFFKGRSPALVSLICRMMAVRPEERPTAHALLRNADLRKHTKWRKYYYIRANIMDLFRSLFSAFYFYFMIIFHFLLHPFRGLESHCRSRLQCDGFAGESSPYLLQQPHPLYNSNGFTIKNPAMNGFRYRGRVPDRAVANGHSTAPNRARVQLPDPPIDTMPGDSIVSMNQRWLRSSKNGVYSSGSKNVSFGREQQPYSYSGRRGNLSFLDSSFSDEDVSDISSIHNSTAIVPPDPTTLPLYQREQDSSLCMSPITANAVQRPWKSTPINKLPAQVNVSSRWYHADAEQDSPMMLNKSKARTRNNKPVRKQEAGSFLRRLDEFDESPIRPDGLTDDSSADEDEEHARLCASIPPKKLLAEFEKASSCESD